MEAAIEAGARDIQTDDEGHEILTVFEDLSAVAEALEVALGPARSTSIVWKAKSAIPAADAAGLVKLIDALEDEDDVQYVWTNAEIAEEDLARLSA